MSESQVDPSDLSPEDYIEVLWPPTKAWECAKVIHCLGDSRFVVAFEADRFIAPLIYDLTKYLFRRAEAPMITVPKVTGLGNALGIAASSSASSGHSTGDAKMSSAITDVVKETKESEFEIEAVIDYLSKPTPLYRVKWKGYGLGDCTWEPVHNLDKAAAVVSSYEAVLNALSLSDPNVVMVRAQRADIELLRQLWDLLTQKKTAFMSWTPPTRQAFEVHNVVEFEKWLQSAACVLSTLSTDDSSIVSSCYGRRRFKDFVERFGVIGFEIRLKEKMFHNPCFTAATAEYIAFIGQNVIPVPLFTGKKDSLSPQKQRRSRRRAHGFQRHKIADGLGDDGTDDGSDKTFESFERPPMRKRKRVDSDSDFEAPVSLREPRRRRRGSGRRKSTTTGRPRGRPRKRPKKRSLSPARLRKGGNESSATESTAVSTTTVASTTTGAEEDLDTSEWSARRNADGCEFKEESIEVAILPQLQVRIPVQANLDLNECHLWTEDHVSIWLNYLNDWGASYAHAFTDNGVDGRILLEYDIEVVSKQCEIAAEHLPQFILAVNQLREVRQRCLQMPSA